MERLHQMNVIPDVLGDLRPTLDLNLVIRGNPTPVEPGSFLSSHQVCPFTFSLRLILMLLA